ncbi:MAG: trypsin-like peptidase domain-containing protein [Spirochaetaceae bacterium]|nr:trypsin-like peptidase domain-containing protein [Spirochaetaceae bacterium]
MEYSKKETRLTLVKIIIVILIFIITLVFLHHWSIKIKQNYDKDELRANVEKILDKEGERGLLSLAGVNVNDIFYDENGVSLILGDSSSWRYTSDEKQNIDVYESNNKSVVYISSTITQSNGVIVNNTGSGIVISKKGEILTNYHVVVDSPNIIVTLDDQSSYKATIIGLDKVDDIALISIDVNGDLSPIKFGRSSSLKIGQKVLAIGNPFGYDRTLTTGIISGLNRVVQTSDKNLVVGMIQTDASINPGNSGGPLLDGHGEMIGMNTSIYTQSDTQGMNFAIPIDTILSLLPDLLTTGKVLRGWLDIVPIQLTKQLASYSNLRVEQGILISQVEKDGEAESAGLKGGSVKVSYGSSTIYTGGDVITNINGREIKNYSDYYNALLTTKKGDSAKVTIIRNNKEFVKTVTLVQRDENLN